MPGDRLVFGLVTGSMLLGLASRGTMSQALAEVAGDDLALPRIHRSALIACGLPNERVPSYLGR